MRHNYEDHHHSHGGQGNIKVAVLDPVLSVLITIYVLYNVVKNLKEILNVLLLGVPKDFSIREIEHEIASRTEVLSVYHTHIWSLEGEKNMLSTHIIVGDKIERKEFIKIKENIRERMKKRGIGHVTIEVDFQSKEYDY